MMIRHTNMISTVRNLVEFEITFAWPKMDSAVGQTKSKLKYLPRPRIPSASDLEYTSNHAESASGRRSYRAFLSMMMVVADAASGYSRFLYCSRVLPSREAPSL